MASKRNKKRLEHFPLQIASAYFAASVAWIIFSDRVLSLLNLPQPVTMALSEWKGICFVSLTAYLLFRTARHWQSDIRTADSESFQSTLEIVQRLATASEYRDDDTGQHNHRIGLYAELVAKGMGFGEQECTMVRYGATLHDLGKIAIPDDILRKPGPLSEQEWTIMRSHTTLGAAILANAHHPQVQVAQTIALTHHECWDGSGYPSQLKGEDIPIEGRIVSVCDVYDALTSARSYKGAWDDDLALKEIKRLSGTKFDPAVVYSFERCFAEIQRIRKTYSGNQSSQQDELRPISVLMQAGLDQPMTRPFTHDMRSIELP